MSQIGLFDGTQPLKINKPIRLIELFAGVGAQAKGLERLGADFEHYRVCEFDKYAVTSYNAIHGTDFSKSDIREWHGADLGVVDTDAYTYVLTYSFPCQDLSICGEKKGMEEGSETRSALLWEVKRLLEETEQLPQILLMENVPQVCGAANRQTFFDWVNFLESLGYKSKWAIMNSRDYSVPQNRERCFMLSWLGDYYYDFPRPKPLEKVLRDLLQPGKEIDENYYLSNCLINYFVKNSKKQEAKGNGFRFSPSDGNCIAAAITTKAGARMDDNFIRCEQGKSPFRKLTQKECWRLMDFDDADYEKARNALNATYYNGADRSGSQLYKQAGNSIVVNCLCEIFRKMI